MVWVVGEPAQSASEPKDGGSRDEQATVRIPDQNRFWALDKTGPGLVCCQEWLPTGDRTGRTERPANLLPNPPEGGPGKPSGATSPATGAWVPRAAKRFPLGFPQGLSRSATLGRSCPTPPRGPAEQPWWKARPEQTSPATARTCLHLPRTCQPLAAPARPRPFIPLAAPDRAFRSDGVRS